MSQLDLFTEVVSIYNSAERPFSNDEVYRRLIKRLSLPSETLKQKSIIGKSRVLVVSINFNKKEN